jgi:chemotaxis protein MotB
VAEDAGGLGHAQAPIIKKVKKAAHGHHGGAWKVAYADMVTALMALFIVLWILSQSEEVRQSVAGYFRDPVGFKEGGVPTLMDGGQSAGKPSVIEESAPRSVSSDSELERQIWKARAQKIVQALARLPSFEKYKEQIEVAVTPDGLRISLIESAQSPLYRVGSLELNPEAAELLETVGVQLAGLDNHLVIEGHTDARPFASGAAMTNWELSTGRAHTARTELERAGVPAGRIFEVRGFADRNLYNPLDPHDSRNRRIAITVLSGEAFEARLRLGPSQLIEPEAP